VLFILLIISTLNNPESISDLFPLINWQLSSIIDEKQDNNKQLELFEEFKSEFVIKNPVNVIAEHSNF
jgi:hypothetical protein